MPVATHDRDAYSLPTETDKSAAARVSFWLNMSPHETQLRHSRRCAIRTVQVARSSEPTSSMVNVLHVDQIDDDVSARPIADEEGDGVPGQPIRSNARPGARRTERDAIA